MTASALRRAGVSFIALFCFRAGIDACSEPDISAVFSFSGRPEDREHYVEGQLGVLRPGFARAYLYVAYRYLRGLSFDEEARESLLRRWDRRSNEAGARGEHAWYEARRGVTGESDPLPIPWRRIDTRSYTSYRNCTPDAFANAAQTLEKRVARFGKESRDVREWLAAQNAVFQNCPEGKTIPPAAPERIDDLIRRDRDYQIAAAQFYAGEFETAENLFEQIGRDAKSPWRTIAPYLSARAVVRRATLRPADESAAFDPRELERAERKLQGILADPRSRSVHGAARSLLGFVRFRLRPADRLAELSSDLMRDHPTPDLAQELGDFTLLIDRFLERRSSDVDLAARFAHAVEEDDLADWILNFQDPRTPAIEHAIDRWRATKSLPWLVAALQKVPAVDQRAAQLLAESERVGPESPAFATLTQARVRLLAALGRTDEARRAADRILANRDLDRSSRNLLLAARTELASSLEEFLRLAPKPVVYSQDPEAGEALRLTDPEASPVLFDEAAADAFNSLPVSRLREAAEQSQLPLELRARIAAAAWTTAVLTESWAEATALADLLATLEPKLAEKLREFKAARSTSARRFAAVSLLLKFPQAVPFVRVGRLEKLDDLQHGRENWWCGFGAEEGDSEREGALPPFVTEADQRQVEAELVRLVSTGTAPNYFGTVVLEWAEKSPRDLRVPEMLHRVVVAARWGCRDDATPKVAQRAFRFLHAKYPASPWTTSTPYWY